MRYQPFHGVQDQDKLESLVASMAANGWVGDPIVVDGEDALTGSHRLAAAEIVNDRWEAGDDVQFVEIETVDLDEVFAEAGIDLVQTMEAAPAGYDFYLEVVSVLPQSLRDAYGIDMH